MALLNFARAAEAPVTSALPGMLNGVSIEVMPRTAQKVEDFAAILPAGTRVYIAHIDGTPIDDMVATAARLRAEGMEPMPHFPARIIASREVLGDWIARYRGEADVRQALLLAGGVTEPVGAYHASTQLLESGAFEGFERLHVAGHPEGNRDIDPDGGTANVSEALRWKQAFSETTDAEMAIVTQFAFEVDPITAWVEGLREAGITLPVHIGIAGPAKLQTLIKFAIACGVGPSLRVLQRRALDVRKLLLPYEPTEVAAGLADYAARHPEAGIEALHIFPLGGIAGSARWVGEHAQEPK